MVWESPIKLNELGKDKKVSLVWIPGHSGIERNDKANDLVEKEASTSFIEPELFCGLGKDALEEQLRTKEEADRQSIARLKVLELKHSK